MIYCKLDIRDINKVDFSEVSEDSPETVRKSLDEKLFIVKYDSDSIPGFILDGSVIALQFLTHKEALALMATDAWSENEDIR